MVSYLSLVIYLSEARMSLFRGFPGGSDSKASAGNAGDPGRACLIPGLGRSPEVGNGNPLQYSCLKYSTDRGAWRATVHGVAESDTTEHTHEVYLTYNVTLVFGVQRSESVIHIHVCI